MCVVGNCSAVCTCQTSVAFSFYIFQALVKLPSKEDKNGQGRCRDYSPEERTRGSHQQMQGLNILKYNRGIHINNISHAIIIFIYIDIRFFGSLLVVLSVLFASLGRAKEAARYNVGASVRWGGRCSES